VSLPVTDTVLVTVLPLAITPEGHAVTPPQLIALERHRTLKPLLAQFLNRRRCSTGRLPLRQNRRRLAGGAAYPSPTRRSGRQHGRYRARRRTTPAPVKLELAVGELYRRVTRSRGVKKECRAGRSPGAWRVRTEVNTTKKQTARKFDLSNHCDWFLLCTVC
jgi:hypothetical protein